MVDSHPSAEWFVVIPPCHQQSKRQYWCLAQSDVMLSSTLALAKVKYGVPRSRALELSRLEHGTQDCAFIVPLIDDMKILE